MTVRRAFWFERSSRSSRSVSRAAATDAHTRYWGAVRRPVACLVFVAPLLGCYEAALLMCPPERWPAFRNGAEEAARMLFAWVGLSHPAVLPAAIVLSLLTWHWTERSRWWVSPTLLGGMLLESLLYAALLVLVGQLQAGFLQPDRGMSVASSGRGCGIPPIPRSAAPGTLSPPEAAATVPAGKGRAAPTAAGLPTARFATVRLGHHMQNAVANPIQELLPRLLAAVGAGLYEETVFRLWLLPLLAWLARHCGVRGKAAWAVAATVCSVAFALAHHLPPAGEPLALFPLVFRTTAGMAFALLFLLRGFGITVGTHAAYDVFVALLG